MNQIREIKRNVFFAGTTSSVFILQQRLLNSLLRKRTARLIALQNELSKCSLPLAPSLEKTV